MKAASWFLAFLLFGVQLLAACSGRISSSPPPRLASLTVSNATLSPAFSPGTTTYTLTVSPTSSWDGTLVSVSATAAGSDASVTIAGRAAPGGAPVDVRLLPGTTTVAVMVAAADGVTKTTYTLSASMGPAEQAKLDGTVVALSADGTTLAITSATPTWPPVVSVTIYARAGSGWAPEASLTEPGTMTFGSSLALSSDGNTLLAGAPLGGGVVPHGGGFVFVRSSGSWSQQAVLQDTTPNSAMGSSVALAADGNTAAVGAELDGTFGQNTGAAYVFARTGSSWTKTTKLYATNAATAAKGATFGHSVALSGDGTRLAVGAQREASIATGVNSTNPGLDDTSAPEAGAVYLYTLGGGTWSLVAYLKASNTPTGETDPAVTGRTGGIFGYSVAFAADGRTLAVGAPYENSIATGVNPTSPGQDNRGSPGAGAVYVFTESAGTWSQSAYVKASNTPTGANAGGFGLSVALTANGTTLATGATQERSAATGVNPQSPAQDDRSLGGAGAVYVFGRSGGTWTQGAYVKASSNVENSFFGASIALSADGATLAAAQMVGKAYVFQ